jgi:hypothetical protein
VGLDDTQIPELLYLPYCPIRHFCYPKTAKDVLVVPDGNTLLGNSHSSRENASKGLWQAFGFLWKAKPGLYFL